MPGLALLLLFVLPLVPSTPPFRSALAGPVEIRTGIHPDFERLVLESPEAAGLPVEITASRVVVGPEVEAGPDEVTKVRRLKAVETVVADHGILGIALRSGAEVRILRLQPDRLVLDFTMSARDAAEQRAGTVSGKRPDVGRAAPPPAGAAAPDIRRDPPASTGSRGPTPKGSEHAPTPAGTVGVVADVRRTPEEPSQRQAPQGHGRAPSGGGGEPPAPAVPAADREGEAAPPESTAAEVRFPGHVGVSGVERAGEPPALVFDWPAPVGAAAYRRSGRIWIVFDGVPESFLLDRPSLAALAAHGLRRIRTYRRHDASLVELLLDGPEAVAVQPDGQRWRVVIGVPRPPAESTALRIEGEALRLAGLRRVLRVADPVVRDTVSVATAAVALPGAPAGRRHVDLTILPSFQGLAWVRRTDDLRVSLRQGSLRIDRPGGLRLSQTRPPSGHPGAAEGDRRPATTPPAAQPEATVAASSTGARVEVGPAEPTALTADAVDREDTPAHVSASDIPEAPSQPSDVSAGAADRKEAMPDTAPVGLPPWKTRSGLAELAGLDPVARDALRRAVRTALAGAPGDRAVALAQELARLQLAEGFAPEALVALELAPETGPTDPRFVERRALIAAASFGLIGKPDPATRLLGAPEFAADPEADGWLGWLAARAGDWETASQRLERRAAVFEAYPEPLRVRFVLAALEAALQTGNADRAYVWLERLLAADADPPLDDRARFLEAMTLARDGAYTEARKLLSRLARSRSWEIAAESVYADIDLAREFAHAGPQEELRALLENRHFWRGHPLEPRVLRRIGVLRSETGDVRGALVSWREALDRYPEDAALADLPDDMRALFAAALDPSTPPDPLPPTMLRIYREFTELRPPSPAGDAPVRHLARALAASGLPEPALALLRSAGGTPSPEASLLEAELALDAGHPEQTLQLIGVPSQSTSDGRMRVLRATALLRLGRPEEALAALGEADGVAAVRVRADAAWNAGHLDILASLADPLLARANGADDPLDRIRAARALAALARVEPQRARELLETVGRAWDAPLLAAARMWLPATPLPNDPRAVAAAAREWVREARDALSALDGPVRAASRQDATVLR
jgi:tetratricopeptide (TPR) repeat protein